MSFLCFHFYPPQSQAKDNMKGPFKTDWKVNRESYGEGYNTFFNFYQKWISPVKGSSSCPMHPSCSQYAKEAFHLLPWYVAYPKSMERILRCGNELHLYRRIRINDTISWFDPVLRKEEAGELEISE
jgi:putative component of membrane protein insertase Oxa1/YidC/SpoIIIJ protein YidD